MEAWTLRSQEIQSLEVFEMCCLQTIRGVTSADRLQNIKIREDTLNLSQMSPDTEDSGGLGMFAVYKEITSLVKYTNKISKDNRREEHHSDQI